MLDTPPNDLADMIEKARAIVIDQKRCSTSFLRRELGIGYNKAARIVEALEDQGTVSAPDHLGKREILNTTSAALPQQTGSDTVDIGPISIEQIRKTREALRKQQGKPPMKHDRDFAQAENKAYSVAADELRQFIEQFESLDAEKKDITEQQKDVMAEAKARGYDTKALKKIVAMRKRDKDDLAEEEAIIDLYKSALGMG